MNPTPELYRVGTNWRMKVKTTHGELHMVPSQYEVALWLQAHPGLLDPPQLKATINFDDYDGNARERC